MININTLKCSLSAAFNNVPELIVKHCGSVYYYSLGPYIPFILTTGYFADTLKLGKIQPMARKGDEQYTCMKNYRLI